MKERGILFSAPMVRAILAGQKTQTRRLATMTLCGSKKHLAPAGEHDDVDAEWVAKVCGPCPYGVPGDRLWVRETHAPNYFDDGRPAYRADWTGESADLVEEPRWKPSIFMLRALSRIDLLVTAERVERLQSITEEDARAEGVAPFFERFASIGRDQCLTSGERAADAEHRASFAVLWDEINGDRALWKSNPWVRVVSFERVRP